MEKKITFHDSDKTRLVGILTEPQETQLSPIVILCHGHASSKDAKIWTRLVPLLAKNGIATFRFDFYGHGESEGELEDLTLTKAIKNCQAAIKLIKEMGYTKIGLAGSSFGGAVSIIVASRSKDLSFLCLKAPVTHYKLKELMTKTKEELSEWKKKGSFMRPSKTQGKDVKMKYSFFLDISKYDGYKAASIIKVPTIIIHGDADTDVPVQQSKKAARLIKGCELHVIKGADHRFTDEKQFDEMLGLIYRFIVQQCKGA
jgi:uncharacterized protein